jgi:hypothetical protein
METTKVYETHHNYSRPFKVAITGERGVAIYRARAPAGAWDPDPCQALKPLEIFVGKSPNNAMTAFSGGAGPCFDGNTILLHISSSEGRFEYIHVGRKIIAFYTTHKIVQFLSPVGNNDFAYPFAVDSAGQTYLLGEGVVLASWCMGTGAGTDTKNSGSAPTWGAADVGRCEDPYEFFYAAWRLCGDDWEKPPARAFQGISGCVVNGKSRSLCYSPMPGEAFDRLTKGRHGAKKLVLQRGDSSQELNKTEYCRLIEAFGADRGFSSLAMKAEP